MARNVAYEVIVGPVPKGERLFNICGEPRCVNPAHMVVASRKQRMEEWSRGTLASRFWKRVNQGGPEKCWEWLGCRTKQGYGKMSVKSLGCPPIQLATHVVYYLTHGIHVPNDKCIMHICDNPPCVNPAHLVLGTIAENTRDMVRKGRHVSGSAKLAAEDVVAIRFRYDSGEGVTQIAADYPVTPICICNIGKRKSWKHI